ncbi:MAG: hypothetical protein PHT87_08590, partial [Bacteroidales bacterium]|nr:hypothetical protein [Bacteroidales bacterium]
RPSWIVTVQIAVALCHVPDLQQKGIVFAECDSKLLRTMKLMGIRVHSLGNGIEYLGSETIPVYSTYDDLVGFFRENQSSYGINQASVVAWNAIVRNNQVSLRRLFWIRIEKYSVKPDVFCPKEKEAVS